MLRFLVGCTILFALSGALVLLWGSAPLWEEPYQEAQVVHFDGQPRPGPPSDRMRVLAFAWPERGLGSADIDALLLWRPDVLIAFDLPFTRDEIEGRPLPLEFARRADLTWRVLAPSAQRRFTWRGAGAGWGAEVRGMVIAADRPLDPLGATYRPWREDASLASRLRGEGAGALHVRWDNGADASLDLLIHDDEAPPGVYEGRTRVLVVRNCRHPGAPCVAQISLETCEGCTTLREVRDETLNGLLDAPFHFVEFLVPAS